MPFVSINSTNQRTNPWNFCEKILRIEGARKWAFFRRPFWTLFFKKKTICLCFFQWKQHWLSYEVSFFLHYEWFLQNLGKDFPPVDLHWFFEIYIRTEKKSVSLYWNFISVLTEILFQFLLKFYFSFYLRTEKKYQWELKKKFS